MHIGRALQEPEQLVDDRLHVQLLGGDERKAIIGIEAHLMAEERERAGPGAVPFAGAALAHAGEEIEILAQTGRFLQRSSPTTAFGRSKASTQAGRKSR